MKSAVCKKANELVRKGYNKSQAFKKAWAVVKYEAQCIKASEIQEGNNIRIEYGDYNNKVACTVVSKSSELFLGKYYVINAVTDNGMKVEFCAKPELLFEKVA